MFYARIGMLLALVSTGSPCLLAQVPNATPQPVAQAPLPAPILIKKTIVFLETDCLHDFTKDAANLQQDALLQMPSAQQQKLLNQLSMIALRLQVVKQRLRAQLPKDKDLVDLTNAEQNRFAANANPNATPQQNADEIEWRLQTLIRQMRFTDAEIASLSDLDLPLIPMDQARGTGFLVGYPDTRITRQPGEVEARLFPYLVTNRHVIQPGIEHGHPCSIVRSSVLLNRKPDATHASSYGESLRTDQSLRWTNSADDSIDLAVTRIGLDEKKYDHVVVPTTQFVSDDDVTSHKVVEGDPVLFAGLFVQTFDQVHTLEPIVRSGSLAMIPEGLLPMTLNAKPGHVYLADAHVFGGNSGSPMFVDLGKFAGVIGGPYLKLLGVISQEVSENSDLTLTIATLTGNVAGNSGVSVVVPASEIKELLDGPALKADRDHQIEMQQSNPSVH
jgi:hypothetical protein